VTYAEIAAFVTRANANVVNDRFRPQIVARPPAGGDALLDLRLRGSREMRLDGPEAGAHYLLEDMQGVRLLDFHGTAGTPVHLVRPAVVGPLYLRRLADGAERTILPGDEVVHLEALPVEPSRTGVRGAAQHAFSSLFALPFDATSVASYEREADLQERADDASRDRREGRARRLRTAEWTALGVGAAAVAAAGAVELWALSLHSLPTTATQDEAVTRNHEITTRNHAATALLVGGGVALTAGIALHIWARSVTLGAGVAPDGARASVAFRF